MLERLPLVAAPRPATAKESDSKEYTTQQLGVTSRYAAPQVSKMKQPLQDL